MATIESPTYTLYRRREGLTYFSPIVSELAAGSLDAALEQFGEGLAAGGLRAAKQGELFIVAIDQPGANERPIHLLRARPQPVRLTRLTSDADLARLLAEDERTSPASGGTA